jgi:hypothetical protein
LILIFGFYGLHFANGEFCLEKAEKFLGLNLSRELARDSELLYQFILDIIQKKQEAQNPTTKTMDIVDMMLNYQNPPFTMDEVSSNEFSLSHLLTYLSHSRSRSLALSLSLSLSLSQSQQHSSFSSPIL